MAVYYVDNIYGNDSERGISPEGAVRDFRALDIKPGDKILFKRGNVYRETLSVTGGEEGKPVTYGAFGDGEPPVFYGSVNVSDFCDWVPTERENIWRCIKSIATEVGNFVFNCDECTATLRWDKEALAEQGDFWDSRFGECNSGRVTTASEQELLMYSHGNPAQVYSHIEAVPYGERGLVKLKSHVVVENICFMNSGVHGLVASSGNTRNVTVRGCTIKNIGGCAWNSERQIRFGNGVEFWIGAENILVENNVFKNIYDSCVTHQGPDNKTPAARNFHCRNNLFDTYSMAAFEYRAQMMVDSSFTDNVCRHAGCGFGMRGETLPRKSEIWPQPMGHHLFFWRISRAAEGGSLLIDGNSFEDSLVGAAVYSIICPEAEAQVTFGNNVFSNECLLFAHWGGKDYYPKK